MKKAAMPLLSLAAALLLWMAGAPAAYADGYFTITKYLFQATVLPNNVYEVTETIDVRFDEPQHGIYRSIPEVVTTYRRVNGKALQRKYRLSVKDIRTDGGAYTVSRSGDFIVIAVGDKDRLVEGEHRYTIRYTMDAGCDFIDEFDEVYLNIIGLGWNAAIENADFAVELPKPFDASRAGAVAGGAGYTNPGQAAWEVSGNTITGRITKPLERYEGLTLRVELPQGYFTGLPDPFAADKILLAAVLLLGAAGAALFLLYGRDSPSVRPVEVAPPDGMNPAELGYVYGGQATARDVLSLLPYWADKGCLSIEMRPNRSFTLHRLKDLPRDARNYEKSLFGELFRIGDSVSSDNLPYAFTDAVYGAAAAVENAFFYTGRAAFTRFSQKIRPWLAAAAALPVMAVLALAFYRNTLNWPVTAFSAVVMGLLGFWPAFGVIRVLGRWRSYRRSVGWVRLTALLALYALSLAAFLLYSSSTPMLPALPAAAALGSAALGGMSVFFKRRTKEGRMLLGRALGFRDFICTVEKDRLAALLEKDPGMFYAILPYAYVLGVTDKWVRNFESLPIRPPDWFEGDDGQFGPGAIARGVADAMTEFQAQASSVSSQAQSGDNTSGSSGSAVAGGGIGGGGGGSW